MPNTSSSIFQKNLQPKEVVPAAVLLKEVAGDEIEGCVSCGTDTPYKKNTHIDLREHYVEGAGQLCKDCWDRTYSKGDGGILLG